MISHTTSLNDDNPIWVPSIPDQQDIVEQNRKLKHSERLIQFLAIFSFSLLLGLFVIQANMAWQSYQMLQQTSKGQAIPDMVFSLYFDYMESGLDSQHVDIRANTSIFVH